MATATLNVTVTLAHIPFIDAIVQTSLAYEKCICEYPDKDYCRDFEGEWHRAVRAFRRELIEGEAS